MSKLTLRALCSLGLAFSLFGVSACSEDECSTNADCEAGLICNSSNECITKFDVGGDVCKEDSQCGDGQICGAGKCEEGCRTNAGCEAGLEFCDTRTLSCKPVPDECASTIDCPDNFICEATSEEGPLKCVPECQEDADCDAGLTCQAGVCTGCLSNDDCGDGEICRVGRCAPQSVQCGDVGLACDPELPVASGYVCTSFPGDESPSCYEACRSEDLCTPSLVPDEMGGFTDMAGFAYFDVITCSEGSVCASSSDGLDACRRSECENPVVGVETCQNTVMADNPGRFPNGVNCTLQVSEQVGRISRGGTFNTLINEESRFFCEPAGTLQRGDVGCLAQASGPLGQAPRCAEGLTCVTDIGLFDLRQDGVEGLCEKPCTNDAQCDLEAGESCVGLGSDREFNTVGVCGFRCEPYTSDANACPAGNKCFAVTKDDGYCTDLVGAPGTSEVYGACTNDQSCPNGTVCLNFGLGARCTPQCDPTAGNQEAANATCMGGDPRGNVKFVHLASNAAAVDIYVDGRRVANDLAFQGVAEKNEGWFDLLAGRHTIDVVLGSQRNNSSPLFRAVVELEANSSQFISVVPGVNEQNPVNVVIVEDVRTLTAPSGTQARIRAAHAVNGVGAVDVVAAADGADVSLTANQRVLAQNVELGEAGTYVNVPANTYDLYIFNAGDVRTAVNAVAIIEDVTVPQSARGTVFAHGSTLGVVPVAPSATLVSHEAFVFIPNTGGYCYDLEQGTTNATRPGTGVCFQMCDGYQDFGGTACTVSATDDCSIFTENTAVCFPQGGGALGDTCVDDDGCGKGLFCDEASDGSGVCRSFCTVEGFAPNPNLAGCQGAEQCFPSEDIDGLGECHLPCTPEAPGVFRDTSCPPNMQTCYPHENYNYYCSASGTTPVNSECAPGDLLPLDDLSCAAGSLCARDITVPDSVFEVLIESFVNSNPEDGSSCRQLCRPFLTQGSASDCEEGYACTPILPSQDINTFAGICTRTTEVGINGNPNACAEVGRLCSDSSFCSLNETTPESNGLSCESAAECFSICNPATNLGCRPDQTCDQLGSTDIPSYFIGSFGICRDRD